MDVKFNTFDIVSTVNRKILNKVCSMNGEPTGDLEGDELVEIVHDVEEDRRPVELKRDVERRDLKVVDHDAVRAPRSQLLVGGHLRR